MTEFVKATTQSKVLIANVQDMPNEQYALERKKGLGATDSSVYLGLMTKFSKDVSTVVEEKCRTALTKEEEAIGNLEAVRKGRDLEDLILAKFSKVHDCEKPMKPKHMYCVDGFEYLTVNYDGVLFENEHYVPVECKFVTVGGNKNYNQLLAVEREVVEITQRSTAQNTGYTQGDLVGMITARAAVCGIPPYYYTQIQQQMLGLDAPYGYLAAMHDKGWELCIYKVPRDEEVIRAIKIEGNKTWSKIERRKGVA